MRRAAIVGCALVLVNGCILDRSGTLPEDGATPPRLDAGSFDAGSFDAGSFDAGSFDAGMDAGFDAGSDAGVDSAVPIPDACVPSAETCDGFDQDCDGIVDDGITRLCTTSCGTGTDTCVMGSWFCDVREPTLEVCDGVDNDCDALTDELLMRGCSTPCGTGMETCIAGSFMGCTVPPPTPEICDAIDNDCNGSTDESLDRPCLVPTMGCGTLSGTQACVGGTYGVCVPPSLMAESCNGRDDDCDAIVDEDTTCPCTRRTYGSHSYLFCATPDGWNDALTACRASGYQLVTINDAGENTFVTVAALADRNDDWWIGITDQRVELTWEWSYGTSSFTRWAPGEPNNFSAGTFDCGNIENGSDSNEDRALWADRPCGDNRPFVCESP